jgi:hypothetical protein
MNVCLCGGIGEKTSGPLAGWGCLRIAAWAHFFFRLPPAFEVQAEEQRGTWRKVSYKYLADKHINPKAPEAEAGVQVSPVRNWRPGTEYGCKSGVQAFSCLSAMLSEAPWWWS